MLALILALMTGMGLFKLVEDTGGRLKGLLEDSSTTTSIVASEPPPPPSNVVRVDPNEAVNLLRVYLLEAGARNYEAAWSMLSKASQVKVGRRAFEDFWNVTALTGFFPDNDPNLEGIEWREDGAVSFIIRLFFDQCDSGIRSIDDVHVVIAREGDSLRMDGYEADHVSRLSHEPASQDVLSTCPQ